MGTTSAGTIAFTASRILPDGAHDVFRTMLQDLDAGLYMTGACIGGDQAIATILAEIRPDRAQRVIVPRDRSRVDLHWLAEFSRRPNVSLAFMPRGTTYRDRNHALLGEPFDGVPPIRPNLLVGFPLHDEKDPRSVRSGSWMTLRLARGKSIPWMTHVLLAEEDAVV